MTSGTTAELTDLQFYDLNIGYIVGENETILKTTNGGTNWLIQNLALLMICILWILLMHF
ncbi:MAG: hypothetical protein IPO92_20015 [Saprospiraceae bacterium]|nr:hypothetical protein [Saprospiraceae bacterium]